METHFISVRLDFLKCVKIFIFFKVLICIDLHFEEYENVYTRQKI